MTSDKKRPPCIIGVYCAEHGFTHGGEAEELRQRLEERLHLMSEKSSKIVMRILDEVDARDSLSFLEAKPNRKATVRHGV